MSPRRYTLGKRAVAAQSTRERILQAAGQLVARHGLTGLTIEEVARDAGVSRLTVYNHFDSRAGLLEALAWSVLERAEIGRVRQARMHPDPGRALRGFVAENAHFLAVLGAQGRAVLAAGLVDPDVRTVIDATYVAARRAAITELVERLDQAERLPPSWPAERAVASLMVLTSLEAFETLTVHSGWATTDAAALLAELAALVLDQ